MNNIPGFFNDFYISKIRFTLKATQPILLNGEKGSAFRGAFGINFREFVCYTMKPDCAPCILRYDCPYAYIFESFNPGSLDNKKTEKIPHPFIIEPAEDGRTRYHIGETFYFDLILVGKAIHYLGYFVYVFHQIGISKGIGAGWKDQYGGFDIVSITDVYNNYAILYDHKKGWENRIPQKFSAVNLFAKYQLPENGATKMIFKTRARFEVNPKGQKGYVIGVNGRLFPDFEYLWNIIYNRILHLGNYYCELDIAKEKPQTEVIIQNQALIFEDGIRKSGRQVKDVPWGGIKGFIVLQGNLDELWPYLALGQVLHIGKSAAMGLGRYELSD